MAPDSETDFRDWAAASRSRLRRTAYLLSGDWHLADDLVQDALTRAYAVWPRVARGGQPDAYVRKILLNLYLDHRRRPARREDSRAELPDAS
ncbi:sigma factor [Nocardioides szechwanensis]|uniref:sigma factor n=1 Tax=Nocardioides szechwanensis TaxID=1005944 RepID=UPI001FE0CE54|nr:sigma factor [Nocardioides szechwanensis]